MQLIQEGLKKRAFFDGKELILGPKNMSVNQSATPYDSTLSTITELLQQTNNAIPSTQSTFSGAQSQSNISPLTDEYGREYYIWDGVYFVSGGYGEYQIDYPHADEIHYEMRTDEAWGHAGNALYHFMYDSATSVVLADLGPVAICGAIGAAIGLLVLQPLIGFAVGAALGIVVWWLGSNVHFWMKAQFYGGG